MGVVGGDRFEAPAERRDRPFTVRVDEHDGPAGRLVPVAASTRTPSPWRRAVSTRRARRRPSAVKKVHRPTGARAARPRPRRLHRAPPTRPSRARCRRRPARSTWPNSTTPCARRRAVRIARQCGRGCSSILMEPRRLTSFSHGAGCGCKLGRRISRRCSAPFAPRARRPTCSWPPTRATTPRWCGCRTGRRWSRRSTCSPRSWTTRTTGAGSPPPTRSPTSTRWAARPFLALNIVGWPVDDLPLECSPGAAGGVDVASKAGAAILGGHTITDPEPKYGMVALGLADPDRIARNSTAPPEAPPVPHQAARHRDRDDRAQARVAEPALLAAAVELMTTLNDAARRRDGRVGAEAATDVTGFGLRPPPADARGLGRGREDGRRPRCRCLPGVLDLAMFDVVPGGPSATTRTCVRTCSGASSRSPSSWCSRTRRPRAGC